MGGHEIMRASLVAQELAYERERRMKIRQHHELAKANVAGQISKPTWFGGIKATAVSCPMRRARASPSGA